MTSRTMAGLALSVMLIAADGMESQALAAAKKKVVPRTITTQQGKTYQDAELIGAHPDGLVIQYRIPDGGLGMTKLKFRNLPEPLRQEFNFDESAATAFENATKEAQAEFAAPIEKPTKQPPVQPGAALAREPQETYTPQPYPVGRFRAAGTIRGAMILDSVTGEAWLVDLHSTLEDYKDRSYFLQPKVLLPPEETSRAIIIGP